jgi:phage/plasmid-like protein (TIGR03299 family)
MSANVGEMFYTGQMPWHGEGRRSPQPLVVDDALLAAGLAWEVGEADIGTHENPSSLTDRRKAIIRLDRPAGSPGRVLGVVHPRFHPLQNRDGARIFDSIFGRGEPVYHTGGYLGDGERIWLLARLDAAIEIGRGDVLQPYALFANSHDGSIAIQISLTTIRVVCQNTLSLALRDRTLGARFRRNHSGRCDLAAEAAETFRHYTGNRLAKVRERLKALADRHCPALELARVSSLLFRLPAAPGSRSRDRWRAYETRRLAVVRARSEILRLSEQGRGMNLPGTAGTYWGALNAITEFVDHVQQRKGSPWVSAFLGKGMAIKTRAYELLLDSAEAALPPPRIEETARHDPGDEPADSLFDSPFLRAGRQQVRSRANRQSTREPAPAEGELVS